MEQDILEKLSQRVQHDYEEYVAELKKNDIDTIINRSYLTSVGQNLVDAIESYIETYNEDDSIYGFYLLDETVEKIINSPFNVIDYWIDNHRNIRHSEQYNYDEWYDDLITVIDHVFGLMGEFDEQRKCTRSFARVR